MSPLRPVAAVAAFGVWTSSVTAAPLSPEQAAGHNREKFGTPETSLRDKRICVTGQISDYQGKPEIVLTDPSQLTQ